jgi:DNA-binding LacI/PurR family transcriptional regulator
MGTNIQTQVELLEACGEALAQHGVPADQVIWMDGRFSESGARKAVRQILKENPRTTAILTTSDKMASGVLAHLHEAGISVPGQISVMGIDNLPASAHFCPALTTIDLHLRDIGALACERLLAMVNEDLATCEELHPVHLVERASTGPAPTPAAAEKPPAARSKKKTA